MGSILTLAGKDLRLLFRDRFALFWVFVFPLMYALFFGSIFGSGDDGARSRMSVAVVDEDGSESSAKLVERLAGHESLRVDREGEGEDGAPILVGAEEARDLVRKGQRVAYLRIPAGFGVSPFAMFGGGDDTPSLEVGIDPARSAEAGFLQGVLMEVVFGGMGDAFQDSALMKTEIDKALEEIAAAEGMSGADKLALQTFLGSLDDFVGSIDLQDADAGSGGGGGLDMSGIVEVVDVTRDRSKRPRSAFDVTFPSAMIWGLMSVAMSFAITLVRERSRGTLLRLRIAPIGRAQLLAGKAFACFLACLIVMTFLAVFGWVALGVRYGNLPLLGMAMACTAVCFTGLMMVAANLGRTEEAVAGATWGVMMPFAMIGGGMIPLIAMPSWLASLSDFSPFKWGIYSVEGAVWRGFSLAEMLTPCGILLAIGAGFFTLGVWLFRRSSG